MVQVVVGATGNCGRHVVETLVDLKRAGHPRAAVQIRYVAEFGVEEHECMTPV